MNKMDIDVSFQQKCKEMRCGDLANVCCCNLALHFVCVRFQCSENYDFSTKKRSVVEITTRSCFRVFTQAHSICFHENIETEGGFLHGGNIEYELYTFTVSGRNKIGFTSA